MFITLGSISILVGLIELPVLVVTLGKRRGGGAGEGEGGGIRKTGGKRNA